jgi:hypothetical protein
LKVTVPFFLEWEMRAFNITPREKEKLMEEQREGQLWRRKESGRQSIDLLYLIYNDHNIQLPAFIALLLPP